MPLLKSQFKPQVCSLGDLSRLVSIAPKQIEQTGSAENANKKELEYKYFPHSCGNTYLLVSYLIDGFRSFQQLRFVTEQNSKSNFSCKRNFFLFRILWNVLSGLLEVTNSICSIWCVKLRRIFKVSYYFLYFFCPKHLICKYFLNLCYFIKIHFCSTPKAGCILFML